MTIEEFEQEWLNDKPYINANTSGSTGTPKAIRLLKSDMKASARATNTFFGLGQGSVFACPLNFDYIAAKMMFVRAQEAGGSVIAIPPSNDFDISYKIDLLAVVPSQVECLLNHPHWASSIKNIIIGGAPLSDERAKSLLEFGYNCWQTYGMTETCSHVALRALGENEYKAMPGVSLSIDNRNCLIVNAPHLSGSEFITNDVVDLSSDKSFVWQGRFDNVINSGGIKIQAEALESKIRSLLSPQFEFYIVGRPDKKWGEAVTMVAETTTKNLAIVEEQLRNLLEHKFVPKYYEAVTEIPRTANGKIKRL